ncbi:MAG: LAGLIDADG endonuclease [bacterium]|nr:LAGLIDADG endonuclease [bacterium]
MDNTVGSLTQEQKSLIIGAVLGDGYLRIIPGRKNAFLETNHSISQKDYVDWKYNILRSIVKSNPKERKGNDQRVAYRFYTQCLSEITELFYRFYINGKKEIPDNLVIDRLTLAVWFMDDGSKSRSSVYLNTQQFSLKDQIKLQNILLNQFNIHSRLNKDKKYFRIRIISSDAKRFCDLVKQFIPKSMEYKLV